MKYIIPDCTDPRLPGAIEEQMVDISRTFESTGYTQVIDTPFMTFTTSKIPHPAFNGVGLTKLTPENSD